MAVSVVYIYLWMYLFYCIGIILSFLCIGCTSFRSLSHSIATVLYCVPFRLWHDIMINYGNYSVMIEVLKSGPSYLSAL
jgi:hypothetical protein